MIKIRMTGGLGNQFFIYSLYRVFVKKGIEVKLDLSWYSNCNEVAMLHIDKFNTKFSRCCVPKEVEYLQQLLIRHGLDKYLAKLGFLKKYYESHDSVYEPKVFEFEDGSIEGCWQSEKYFKTIENVIREELKYVGTWNEMNVRYRECMKMSESVSVHIRRGDYLKLRAMYGDICDLKYYKNSISYIMSIIESPHFFIFSDDLDWSKENILTENGKFTFVEGNRGKCSYMDMVLMTFCKHHIIANSSFSWWGAWLGGKNNGVTIAPSRWLNTAPTPDIWCDGWIKI